MSIVDKLFLSNIVFSVFIIIAAVVDDRISDSKAVNNYIGISFWTVPIFIIYKIFI